MSKRAWRKAGWAWHCHTIEMPDGPVTLDWLTPLPPRQIGHPHREPWPIWEPE